MNSSGLIVTMGYLSRRLLRYDIWKLCNSLGQAGTVEMTRGSWGFLCIGVCVGSVGMTGEREEIKQIMCNKKKGGIK
jgi:hypothetical protein